MKIRVLRGKFVRIKKEFLEEYIDDDTGQKELRIKQDTKTLGLSGSCFWGYENTIFQVRRDFYGIDINGIGHEAIGVSFGDDFKIPYKELPNSDDLHSPSGIDSSKFLAPSHRIILDGCPCGNMGVDDTVDWSVSWDARFFEVVKVKETIKVWETDEDYK